MPLVARMMSWRAAFGGQLISPSVHCQRDQGEDDQGRGGDDGDAGDASGDQAEPEVADRLAGVPGGRLMRLDGRKARRGVTALGGDVAGMDPQEHPRMPGPGQPAEIPPQRSRSRW